MKKILLTFLLFNLINTIIAQSNLVLSLGSVSTTSLKRGDQLNITLRVANTGNAIAGKSHTKIYVSNALSFTNAVLLSEISCESLLAGQETKDINFVYPLPYTTTPGLNYILVKVDSRNEVVESDENNGYRFIPTITVSSIYGGQQNLPYPIIFVHGLNSDNNTWANSLIDYQNNFGWSYGGNMNFCLNQRDSISNKFLDYKDWTDTNALAPADFFTINFNVDRNGYEPTTSTDVLSNQSAVVKQGMAIKDAVKHVLNKTNKDKVILVGHSMGGLASREYLQNNYLWQTDGKHHIAKLLTVGTPHGGSNFTGFGIGTLVGTDEHSEAVRDLRTTYFYSGDSGVYLFGGIENYSTMNDAILDFYNVDVNCNGIDADGTNIKGLNDKSIPSDLVYSCIIGNYSLGVSDGVVYTYNANLNNFKQVNADTFLINTIHTSEPSQTQAIVKGLDEANEYNTAYSIDLGKSYFSNFSVQSRSPTSYIYDYDDYKSALPSSGLLNCRLYNIATTKCYFNLLDSQQYIIYRDSTNGQGYYEFNKTISKEGKYYIEFFTQPEETTWLYPYSFKLNFRTIIPVLGNVISPKKIAIKSAIVNLSKDSISSMLSDANGKYNFALSKIGNYTLRPTKNNDIAKANGVTSVDVLLTQRHILNTTKLNSPYKLIAADVDGNKAINSVDVLRMKRLILGTDTAFVSTLRGSRLWEFVDSSYIFPDTTNPFPFKDSISFTNLTSNKINQTFIGVKLGDVNYDWNPLVAKGLEAKPVELVYNVISTKEKSNKTDFSGTNLRNDELRIPITVNNFKDIAAMQYTLHFDNTKYEFVGIENNKLDIDFNIKQVSNNGNISFLWTDKNAEAKTLEDGTELFVLVLRSTVDRGQSTDLTLTSEITEVAAWDKDFNQRNIILSKQETTTSYLPVTTNQWSVSPNPTSGEIKVSISSKANKTVSFKLTDAQGKTIYKQAIELKKGNNNFILNLKQNGNLTTGIYFLKAVDVEGENVKRIIVK